MLAGCQGKGKLNPWTIPADNSTLAPCQASEYANISAWGPWLWNPACFRSTVVGVAKAAPRFGVLQNVFQGEVFVSGLRADTDEDPDIARVCVTFATAVAGFGADNLQRHGQGHHGQGWEVFDSFTKVCRAT